MPLLVENSLAATLDNLNEALFFQKKISPTEKKEVGRWIASRAGSGPRTYAGMPGPTEGDLKKGIKLFTGERVMSGAAVAHILGEESIRALILSGVKDKIISESIEVATLEMRKRLGYPKVAAGWFCCGMCSVSLWRNLAAGGFDTGEFRDRFLSKGMTVLNSHRIGDGKWRRFPFYYTLLALSEIDDRKALAEIKYAGDVIERLLKRKLGNDMYGQRRHELMVRAISRI